MQDEDFKWFVDNYSNLYKQYGTSASNSSVVNTYYIDVILPGCKEMFGIIASQANIEAQGLGMLIGMDIISQGDFAISNFNETTVFTFRSPSKATIDFVKEIVDEKEAK